jgi:ethanolamine ammonia-lyase small subunit
VSDTIITPNPWQVLRRFTAARIALGHTGVSQPTSVQLEFQLAHARARDAVHLALDTNALRTDIEAVWPEIGPCVQLHSAAADRNVYLQRPDLGRRLDDDSRAALAALRAPAPETRPYDVALVVADGLSALAVAQNAAPFLQVLRALLQQEQWLVAPPAIVVQGRVAVGDEVGELLGANMVVVLIGERPGLSSPDSMGLYVTWAPRVGLTDERRNCISNVRPAGLRYDEAAGKLHYLLAEARRRGLTGVELKDETSGSVTVAGEEKRNFLL